MASTSINIRKATVLWWNSSSVAVRCCFCDGIHHHGFNGYDAARILRVSHCYILDQFHSYQFAFPFNEATRQAWFSINKEKALYVAAGENPAEDHLYKDFEEGSDHDEMLSEISEILDTKRKWYEATETVTRDILGEPYEEKRLRLIVSDMIFGNYREVERYLQSSSEANLFLLGIEASYIEYLPPLPDAEWNSAEEAQENEVHPEIHSTGKTALHLAACEQYPQMVQLLLDKGADPNARDVQGQTPLAHACLWGRLENVKHLLAHGADKTIPSVRDGCLMLPVDYARASKENAEDRHSVVGDVYHENTFQRDKDRREILNLLDEFAEENLVNREPVKPWAFAFNSEPRNLAGDGTIITMSAHFEVPNEWKTVGVLCRVNGFPPIAAMSGWRHSEHGQTRVGGKDWTYEVRKLAMLIGFSLEPHLLDGDVPGNYNACHAEKQLIAYFISQHRILPYDESQQQGQEGLTELQDKLVAIDPPLLLTKADIMEH